ncbi:MAG TPA: porin [Gammaproteobacteria bacterium]|nr:porin [Gammaproteobacteria bacterium]
MLLNRSHCKPLLGAFLAAFSIAATTPALAANDAMLELLRVLKDKGTIDQQTYEQLKGVAQVEGEQITKEQEDLKKSTKETTEKVAKEMPKIDTKGKIQVSSPDGDFTWQFIGRVQADYDAIDSDSKTNKIGSGGELRRARLGIQGKMWHNWLYKFEWDFPGNAAKDAFVGYTEDKGTWFVKAGQQAFPFGLVTYSSDNFTLFVERPLLGEKLQDEYDIGLGGLIHGEKLWTLQGGVFTGNFTNTPPTSSTGACGGVSGTKNNRGCSEVLGGVVRGTVNPYMPDANHLVHVGGAAWYRDPQKTVINVAAQAGRFNRSPTLLTTAPFFQYQGGANNGRSNIDDIFAWNAEGAVVWGPFHLQTEYTQWDVDRSSNFLTASYNGKTATLQGYYAEAGFFLTPGDSMNFDAANAAWGPVQPKSPVGKGGWGALQVAVRYDTLDLNDTKALVEGGEEEAVSAGVNWYVNANMRFMADYIQVINLDTLKDSTPTTPLLKGTSFVFNHENPSAFVARAQVFW